MARKTSALERYFQEYGNTDLDRRRKEVQKKILDDFFDLKQVETLLEKIKVMQFNCIAFYESIEGGDGNRKPYIQSSPIYTKDPSGNLTEKQIDYLSKSQPYRVDISFVDNLAQMHCLQMYRCSTIRANSIRNMDRMYNNFKCTETSEQGSIQLVQPRICHGQYSLVETALQPDTIVQWVITRSTPCSMWDVYQGVKKGENLQKFYELFVKQVKLLLNNMKHCGVVHGEFTPVNIQLSTIADNCTDINQLHTNSETLKYTISNVTFLFSCIDLDLKDQPRLSAKYAYDLFGMLWFLYNQKEYTLFKLVLIYCVDDLPGNYFCDVLLDKKEAIDLCAYRNNHPLSDGETYWKDLEIDQDKFRFYADRMTVDMRSYPTTEETSTPDIGDLLKNADVAVLAQIWRDITIRLLLHPGRKNDNWSKSGTESFVDPDSRVRRSMRYNIELDPIQRAPKYHYTPMYQTQHIPTVSKSEDAPKANYLRWDRN